MSSSLFISFDILMDKFASVNSSLGIDTYLIGLTLDFPIRREQWVVPNSSINLRYEHNLLQLHPKNDELQLSLHYQNYLVCSTCSH